MVILKLEFDQVAVKRSRLTWEECRPCPVFVCYTLAFALQLKKKAWKKTQLGYKPGQVGFYPVLPLDCVLSDWLAGRACRSGRTNEYWFMVADDV
jgi:hypothetical protein